MFFSFYHPHKKRNCSHYPPHIMPHCNALKLIFLSYHIIFSFASNIAKKYQKQQIFFLFKKNKRYEK